MNVRESLLREKIDPALTLPNLSLLGSRALGRSVQAASAGVLTGGCWNRVVSVSFDGEERELVIKISPKAKDDMLEREYSVLKFFSENTEMPVAEPLLSDTTGEVIPGSLLIMNRVPGSVMHQSFGHLSGPMRESVSRQIGRTVSRLHETHSEGFGGVELAEEKRTAVWPDFWLPRFDKALEEISQKNLVDPSFLDAVLREREKFPDLLDIGSRSTLTHYDIWSGNVMLDVRDHHAAVSGYIDVPGFWADYARELSFMEMFGVADSPVYEEYRSVHSLDAGFAVRKNIYNLKMHIRHIMMYPDQSFYRQGARACLTFLQANS